MGAPAAGKSPRTRVAPPYRAEEVTFSNAPANLSFSGVLTIPAGPGPFPAVVLMSDAGAHDRDGMSGDYPLLGLLADYLTRRGIAVLRFDDRGVGQSGGALATATTADLVTDLRAGLLFMRTRPEIDAVNLGVIGHGEGGNVGLLAAAQPLPPAFVVTLAAHGIPGYDAVLQQQANTMRSLGAGTEEIEAAKKHQQALLEIVRQTADGGQAQAIVANMLRQHNPAMDQATARTSAAELTSPHYRHFLSFDPLAELAKVSCPVLLLNGDDDLSVSADANLGALAKGLKNSRTVVSRKLPGVNHLFQPAPKDWPTVNGEKREVFSLQAQEALGEWIVLQCKK